MDVPKVASVAKTPMEFDFLKEQGPRATEADQRQFYLLKYSVICLANTDSNDET